MKSRIKNIKIEKYYQYIPAILIFVIGLVLSFFRWASQDEVVTLRETMIMSEFLKMGKWFGNEDVGSHGFLFKVPVAIAYLVTGPSVWVATFFNIILASITAFIMHKVFYHFTKNNLYAMLAVILAVFSYYYVAVVPKYLRDIPVMFALFIFIYAVIKEKPYWLLGLLFLLVLDAKEYIAVILTPVLFLWLPITEFQKNKFSLKFFGNILYKPILLFAPSVLFLYLMFYTPIVPVNYFTAAFLKLTATESNIAKVNLEKQSLSFGTDTSKIISIIETDTVSEEAVRKAKIEGRNYIRALEPVKKSLELRAAKPKRTVLTKEFIAKKEKEKTEALAKAAKKPNKTKKEATKAPAAASNKNKSVVTSVAQKKQEEKPSQDTSVKKQSDSTVAVTKVDTAKKQTTPTNTKIAKAPDKIDTAKKQTTPTNTKIAKAPDKKDTAKKQTTPTSTNIAKAPEKIDTAKKQTTPTSTNIAKAPEKKDTAKKQTTPASTKAAKTTEKIDTAKKQTTPTNTKIAKAPDKIDTAKKQTTPTSTKIAKAPEKIDTAKKQTTQANQIPVAQNQQPIKKKPTVKLDTVKSLDATSTGKKIGALKDEEAENLQEEKFFKLKQSSDSLVGQRSELMNKLENIGISILNVFIVYGQKILSPRTFSYMSFPLYLIIFSIIACISLLKKNYKRPDFLFISIYLFMFLAVYLIRPSHARYLLHAVPILSLFVIFFFVQGLDNYKKLLIPILITLPLTAATLYFEITMPLVKLIAHIFFYLLLFAIAYLLYDNRKELAKKASIAFILLLSFFTFGSYIVQSYTQGQIIQSLTFGQNNEYKEIAKYFDKNKTYWFNTYREHLLIQFYNRDINQGIPEWRYSGSNTLQEWLPKSQMESKYSYIPNFYHHAGYNRPKSHSDLNTDYIALLYSKRSDIASFPSLSSESMNQEVYLNYLKNPPEWLELEKKVELKNKELYIYKVKYE